MSQAEKESNEDAGLLVINPACNMLDLYDGLSERISQAEGYLRVLARDTEDISAANAAWGLAQRLDEAGSLLEELQRRIDDLERPKREAAERRQWRAEFTRDLAKLAHETLGKDKATAGKLAREVVAQHYAKRGAKGGGEAKPANGNGGAQ